MPESINSLVQETEFLKDGTKIPKEEAVQLIRNYKDTSGWGNNKTRGVWFSTDELRTIIEMITKVENGDGVRIYLGRYAADQTGVPAEYKSRETLVYIPTTIRVIPGGYAHRNLFDVETLVNTPPSLTTKDDEGFNHGELCPPKCG